MPGTWPEAEAAKKERLGREHRHYTPDLIGPPCARPGCDTRLVKAYADLGYRHHPTCGPEAAALTAAGIR